jgi:hypothetical protein
MLFQGMISVKKWDYLVYILSFDSNRFSFILMLIIRYNGLIERYILSFVCCVWRAIIISVTKFEVKNA